MAPTTPASPRKRPPPTTGAALIAQARVKNRVLALAVVVFMTAVFVLSIIVTVASHREAMARHHAALSAAAVTAAH